MIDLQELKQKDEDQILVRKKIFEVKTFPLHCVGNKVSNRPQLFFNHISNVKTLCLMPENALYFSRQRTN